tara:strand:- start:355 stop:579 length:225 start_codon:yes stop_codon:yes gene_type:complete
MVSGTEITIMPRGTIRPLIKPFPKGKQHTWQQQKLFMHLSDKWEDIRSPFDSDDVALYGDYRSLYGQARYTAGS